MAQLIHRDNWHDILPINTAICCSDVNDKTCRIKFYNDIIAQVYDIINDIDKKVAETILKSNAIFPD